MASVSAIHTLPGAPTSQLPGRTPPTNQKPELQSNFLQGKGSSHGKLRPGFSKSLAPLDVSKRHQSYIHVEYSFKPSPGSSSAGATLEPITLTISTPLVAPKPTTPRPPTPRTPGGSRVSNNPLDELNAALQAHDVVRDLGRLFQLPSPDSHEVDITVEIKRHPYADLQVGARWQDIQGKAEWDGLMGDEESAIDPVLRGEIMRYGEFAQATYDAFDYDHDSDFCGTSMYDKEKLLEEVGLSNRGYEIKEFIYATAEAHLIPKFFKRHPAATAAEEEGREPDEDRAWTKDSNFMGFVAVCTSPRELKRLGRRDIVVAWRGTVTNLEWVENLQDFFSPAGMDPRHEAANSKVMVESGFLSVYKSKNEKSKYNKKSAREQVLAAVKGLVQKYQDEELSISVTGHSLGSALSMLCAYDIAESGINKREHAPLVVPRHWDEPHIDANRQQQALEQKLKSDLAVSVDQRSEPQESRKESGEDRVPVSVFSFAGPRLGNEAFKERIEELGVKVLRMVNVHDVVPKVPGVIFNEKFTFLQQLAQWLPPSYVHVGKLLELDTLDSDFLKETTNWLDAHNMEAYLHLLDGYHGPNLPFSPAVKRDIALVNKASGFLQDKFGIPSNWWSEKKMVRDPETGNWVVPA